MFRLGSYDYSDEQKDTNVVLGPILRSERLSFKKPKRAIIAGGGCDSNSRFNFYGNEPREDVNLVLGSNSRSDFLFHFRTCAFGDEVEVRSSQLPC